MYSTDRCIFSSSDLCPGDKWAEKILDNVSKSKFCVVCLTPDNIHSNWINFEAGALSSKLARVSALLIGLDYNELEYPLAIFQSIKPEKADLLKLLFSINDTLDHPVDKERIETNFMAFYNNFETAIKEFKVQKSSKRCRDDKIDKIYQNSEKACQILDRMEALMPRIAEEIDAKLPQTDIKVKYNVLTDKLSKFLTDFNLIKPEALENQNVKFLFEKNLNFIKDCMKNDPYIKMLCEHMYNTNLEKSRSVSLTLKRY